MSDNRKEGFALLIFGEALGITKPGANDILDPNDPEQSTFIPPCELLNARTAASARARGVMLPWKQYEGEA